MNNSIFYFWRLLFVLFIGVAFVMPAHSQPGSNDPTFNVTDQGFGFGDGASSTVNTTAIQSDGKIVIVGGFTIYNATERNYVSRINTDGNLDAGFNPGTGANNTIQSLAIQSDGKIIIAGLFTFFNGIARSRIARLNTDGSLDASFNSGTGANLPIQTCAIQSDGKIIIGGDFTSFNGTAANRIARLNSNGSLDAGFNTGTGANITIQTIAIQSDGKIIISGDFISFNGTARNRVARLNTDGSLDVSFTPGTGANNTIRASAIQSDGKIIIGGDFITYNGATRIRITRLNTDGSLDAGFNTGAGANNSIRTCAIQGDGKIVVGGLFTSYNGTVASRIARLNTDGSLDAGFNIGTGANNTIFSANIQSDGKIIIGGGFTSYNGTTRNYITRLNTGGGLDAGFNTGTGANFTILTTSTQSDGKIIIGGDFTAYNGTVKNRITRLNADGSLDAGFISGTGASLSVRTIPIQSDGRIIICGDFASYNGTAIRGIARLNTDGSLDAGFNPGTGANSTIYSASIQSDGKIIIGGTFTSYNGTVANRIARLNSDGSLDAGFNSGTGANTTINTISIQSDGKIIISGDFTTYNGAVTIRIARLNTDGSLDASFNTGTGANSIIWTNGIQSDGKIIIGGNFSAFNGTARSRIARLNTDGSVDAGFNPGTGTNSTIFSTSIQSDGKVIIGGDFTTYNGTLTNRIARLNTDGSLDAGFNTGTGADNRIFTTAIQNDGKIIIGGWFAAYNGTGRNRLARVISSGAANSSTHYFRTIISGNWNTPAAWESSPFANFSSGVISPATLAPDINAKAITIRSPHSIIVTATIIAGPTNVATGGTLTVMNGVNFTVK